jgi:hypothetical protein
VTLRTALALLAAVPAVASAQAIVRPTSAVINGGGPGVGSIADTFNGAGLSTNFVGGVTDFDAYLASNPTHGAAFTTEWFTEQGVTSATVTYDLGAVLGIDRFALWNEDAAGVALFNLLGSTNGTTFTTILSGVSPADNPVGSYPAQVFGFAAVDARYVRFEALRCPQPTGPATTAAASARSRSARRR